MTATQRASLFAIAVTAIGLLCRYFVFKKRRNIVKKIIKDIAIIAFGVLVGLLGALVLAEWAVGCGETYTDSKGVTHSNQCLFIKATQGEIK
jgi:hypothetical protein